MTSYMQENGVIGTSIVWIVVNNSFNRSDSYTSGS